MSANALRQFRRRRFAALALFCLVPFASIAGQTADRFSGTWVLDQDRSTFEPLANRPDRRIVTLAVKADELTSTTETGRTVITDVEPFQEVSTSKVTYSAKFDGREYPVPNSTARIKLKRVSATTFERTAVTGSAREVATWTVSADGKTLTVTTKGMDEYGMAYGSTQVYRRQ